MSKLSSARIARRIGILAVMSCIGWTVGAAPSLAMNTDMRAAVFVESDAIGVGAGVLTTVGSNPRWMFNPNVEFGFGDQEDLVAMNGDFHYDFTSRPGMSAWMGAGPAVVVTKPSVGDSRADLGLNLLTGLSGTNGTVRPFAQLKGLVSDESQLVLQGGIRF